MTQKPYFDLIDETNGFIRPGDVGDRGRELSAGYQAACPFPHAIIDHAFPEPLLDTLLQGFGSASQHSIDASYDRAQERYKTRYDPDKLPVELRTIFHAFNSRPFIVLLQNITGIRKLIPDPYFLGAGLHEISQGGHLSVHADFNHHVPMNLERRINVLIYLNKDWREEYGGQLELWNEDMTARVVSLVPLYNRCVIFNTTSDSQHGNPQPVAHPDGTSRKSIALYYYTATWTGEKRSHTTQFQVRPGSPDRVDWMVKWQEARAELLPPILSRAYLSLKRRLSR